MRLGGFIYTLSCLLEGGEGIIYTPLFVGRVESESETKHVSLLLMDWFELKFCLGNDKWVIEPIRQVLGLVNFGLGLFFLGLDLLSLD